VTDGSLTAHAAALYRGDEKPPTQNKSKYNKLVYLGDEKWDLKENDETLRVYNSSDLRISLLYRSRCFENFEASEKFLHEFENNKYKLNLEDILSTLVKDLIDKKIVPLGTTIDSYSRLDLGLLLMDSYLEYPLPSKNRALFPYNYCMMSES
jgi:hypothetical protein